MLDFESFFLCHLGFNNEYFIISYTNRVWVFDEFLCIQYHLGIEYTMQPRQNHPRMV
jgi:hypothetical protein